MLLHSAQPDLHGHAAGTAKLPISKCCKFCSNHRRVAPHTASCSARAVRSQRGSLHDHTLAVCQPLCGMEPEVLPIRRYEQDIVEAAKANPTIVVIGETGSGKTTQISQVRHRRPARRLVYNAEVKRAPASPCIHSSPTTLSAADLAGCWARRAWPDRHYTAAACGALWRLRDML